MGATQPDPDPEIPVLTITDLGMVRNVTQMGEGWVIGFTPTYSGCPATEHLIGAIRGNDNPRVYPRSGCAATRPGMDHRLDDPRCP